MPSIRRRTLLSLQLAALGLSWRPASWAARPAPRAGGELRIALSYDPSSLDPHFAATAGNVTVSSHVFDCLVGTDPSGKYVPALALSWRAVDPTTWEIKLRPGVTFSDGTDFTADDVAFSLERPARIVNSPGPFTSYTKPIRHIQVVDPLTLRLKTAEPYGPLPGDLASVFIVSRKAAREATTEDFNAGRAMVGTGPFQFASYKRGDRVAMVRNAAYWGEDEKSAWQAVTIRFIPNAPARVAALLAGDVDMIEGVPPSDMPRLKLDAKLQVVQRSTWRTLFLHLNHGAADNAAVFIDPATGQPLGRNPLRDIRVREALSLGLNRPALVRVALEDFAIPAGQLVAEGVTGYDPSLKPGGYDVARARQLLRDAGYSQGFGIVLTVPNNRYINDSQVGQTIAQLWSRIGIKARLQAMPMATYVPKMKAGEFGAALLGWGTLGADFGLRTLLGTLDPAKGWGTWNWGKYSNPKLDAQIAVALGSTDPAQRDANARLAMGIAMKDFAVLPTHYQSASWAMRKGLTYPGRLDEFTFAQQVRPAPF